MHNPPPLSLLSLDPDFKVILEEAPDVPLIPEAFSNALFEKASENKPLFDGTLVCVKDFSSKLVSTYSISYKEYLASNHFPNYPHSHKPLAVSGWILHKERLLFGVRSNHVLQFSGDLELVPSGGIDSNSILDNQEVHYQRALEIEFEEETGMSSQVIERIEPEGLLYCPMSSLYDICQSIHIHPEQEIDCDASNEEYSKLFWVPLNELKLFVEENKSKIIPTSLALIQNKILS